MKQSVDLSKLQETLESGNPAIKKHALAILLNGFVVESIPLLEKIENSDPEPEICSLASKVKQKLMSQEKALSETKFEQILDQLEKLDSKSRLTALRSLLPRQSKIIPRLIRDYFFTETEPEASNLILDIFMRNPSSLNFDHLSGLLKSPIEELRFKAFETFEKTLHASIYPNLFQALIDPNQKVKMQAYQFLGKLGRSQFLETLSCMLKSQDLEMNRLAGELFPPFLGNDMFPLLSAHLAHSDSVTAAGCRKALEMLAKKGNFEAATALGMDQGASRKPSNTHDRIRGMILNLPPWLSGSPGKSDEKMAAFNPIQAMRKVFTNIRVFLGFSFLCSYLAFGARKQRLDLKCFRAIERNLERCNTIEILRAISPALPTPKSPQGLFPLLLGSRISQDENEVFLDQLLSFLEVFRLVDQNQGYGDSLMATIVVGFSQLLEAVSKFRDNYLVVKTIVNGQPCYYDFNTFPCTPIEPKLISNFDLGMHCPTFISGDFSAALNVSPFLYFDLANSQVYMQNPDEKQLIEFLSRHQIMEAYMDSIIVTYVTDSQSLETNPGSNF